ncbi:sulfite exporter TauE/SafE family protein [Blastococcus deserti]|uniref:Probable membrane transporter protein n=1 Tax=Blastococcus deserti TaxID=2259033 RepID=A0ABW4XEB2_9ACTN
MDASLLVVGGVVVLGASVLGGVTGFGFSLVCAPLLLLAGFPLADVVVVNLTISGTTRVATVIRLRHFVNRRRAVWLVAGCVPGLLVGFLVRDAVDDAVLKVGAGGIAVLVAAYLLFRPPTPREGDAGPPPRLQSGVAGVLGGFLGITTSLNGPPPVILLSRQRAEQREFVADMAVYLIVGNGLALLLIQLGGGLALDRLGLLLACWLPVALAGNAIGLAYGSRLPADLFRLLTLGLVVIAGLATVVTTLSGR